MFAGALALGWKRGCEGSKSPYRRSAENRFWLKIKNRDFQRSEPVKFRRNKPR